jgi:hypothetical protein
MNWSNGCKITECWMCCRPADSECVAKLVMNAPADRCLDALGYPVQRGSQLDRVFLEMPRCRSCHDWTSDWIVAFVAATIAGGITGAIAQAFASPSLLGRVGFGNGGAVIGFMLGSSVRWSQWPGRVSFLDDDRRTPIRRS